MAVMSRAKQAKGRGWAQKNEARVQEGKPNKEVGKKEVSEEEHQEKMDLLKKIGLVKEE